MVKPVICVMISFVMLLSVEALPSIAQNAHKSTISRKTAHHGKKRKITHRGASRHSNIIVDSYVDMHGKVHKGAPRHGSHVKSAIFHFGNQ